MSCNKLPKDGLNKFRPKDVVPSLLANFRLVIFRFVHLLWHQNCLICFFTALSVPPKRGPHRVPAPTGSGSAASVRVFSALTIHGF